MKTLVCDFSVDFTKEVEDILLYDDVNFSEERMTKVVQNMMKQNLLVVGERCEGSIECELGTFYVDYQYCLNVGEDWDSDEWIEDQTFEVNILKV